MPTHSLSIRTIISARSLKSTCTHLGKNNVQQNGRGCGNSTAGLAAFGENSSAVFAGTDVLITRHAIPRKCQRELMRARRITFGHTHNRALAHTVGALLTVRQHTHTHTLGKTIFPAGPLTAFPVRPTICAFCNRIAFAVVIVYARACSLALERALLGSPPGSRSRFISLAAENYGHYEMALRRCINGPKARAEMRNHAHQSETKQRTNDIYL